MLPEPEFDPVVCVCYCIFRDDHGLEHVERGTVWVDNDISTMDAAASTATGHAPRQRGKWLTAQSAGNVTRVESEQELLRWLSNKVRAVDPDFLLGWELEKESWGYRVQRGDKLGLHAERSSYVRCISIWGFSLRAGCGVSNW